jgi:16S rRNA (cytidine1402-2'-O)-methyltransferase
VTAALAASGLPADRFCVETGPVPPARLAELAAEPRTLVFVDVDPAAVAAAFGPDRPAALYPPDRPVARGPVGALAGTGVLVVAGAPAVAAVRPDDAGLRAEVADHEAGGTPRREAIALVARRHGLPRREVYQAVITR